VFLDKALSQIVAAQWILRPVAEASAVVPTREPTNAQEESKLDDASERDDDDTSDEDGPSDEDSDDESNGQDSDDDRSLPLL
jgi:hypothetical protein